MGFVRGSQVAIDAHILGQHPINRTADVFLLLFTELLLSERFCHFRVLAGVAPASPLVGAHSRRCSRVSLSASGHGVVGRTGVRGSSHLCRIRGMDYRAEEYAVDGFLFARGIGLPRFFKIPATVVVWHCDGIVYPRTGLQDRDGYVAGCIADCAMVETRSIALAARWKTFNPLVFVGDFDGAIHVVG